MDSHVFDRARDPGPELLYRKKEDFIYYIDYIEEVMDELLSKYQITGIWLDMIAALYGMGRNISRFKKFMQK